MEQNLNISNWIWTPGERRTDEPCIVYFRKQIEKAGPLRISANCRYKLYINGRFVQEGPQKGCRETAYVDKADIGAYCAEQINTIAVEVLYYPENADKRNDSLYYSPFPCLYVEDTGTGKEADGKTGWKCRRAEHISLSREPFNPAPICGAETVSECEEVVDWKETGYGTKEKPEVYTPFLFRTFRYIRVKISTKEQGMSLLKYDYLSTGYPLEVKTHLVTSDDSLNRIWDMSLRTLKRCMHETYVDCPFYEQLQYTMDSRAEILFTYAVAADDRLARQCIEAFRRTQRTDGILQASAPAESVNVIPGFSIFYILMLHDHMMYFGDKALIRDHFGCMDRVLEYFHSHLTEKGLVGSVGGVLFQHKYWFFIDWCEEWDATIGVPGAAVQGDGSITMESLLYLYGLTKAAELADYIGRDGIGEEYRKRAEALREAILKHCTGKEGLIQDGPGLELYSTHCQVWAVLNDLVSEEQGRSNLKKTFGVQGIPQCSVSMSFYLLLAMQKTGMLDAADKMWDMWRKMLENNMTTCVENFTDERSDCHAWGAVILYALPAVYLGIRPTKPGFAEYGQKRDLGHVEWIRGEVVTPRGMIQID